MRWCLSILPCILLLFALGMELCVSPGGVLPKDQPHSVFLDDDDAESELKDVMQREATYLDLGCLDFTGLFVITRFAKPVLVLSLEETEVVKLTSGVRRHRWLCRECC